MKPILVFHNERELMPFINYAALRWEDRKTEKYEKQVPSFPPAPGMNMEYLRDQYLNGLILKDMLNDYYKNTDI